MQWQKNFMQENQNISLGYNLFTSTQVELNCMQVMDRKQQWTPHVNSEQTWKAKKPPHSIPLISQSEIKGAH